MYVIRFLMVAVFLLVAGLAPVGAVAVSPASSFGGHEADGVVRGQVLARGGGVVTALDAFLSIAGEDLNGAAFGISAQLGVDDLPPGLTVSLSDRFSSDGSDRTLRYALTNNTGSALSGLSFFFFADAEIDEAANSFYNEYAVVSGVPGSAFSAPTAFEIDEPGFQGGDLFDNLLLANLDNGNGVPVTAPDDVAVALGFSIDRLEQRETRTIEIMISEDGDRLGTFAITQSDMDSSTTHVTYSGRMQTASSPVAVPGPGASVLWLLGLGLAGLAWRYRRTG